MRVKVLNALYVEWAALEMHLLLEAIYISQTEELRSRQWKGLDLATYPGALCVCMCMVGGLKICPVSKFQVYNTVLLTIVALLYIQFSSVTQLCPTLCDPMNRSTPGLPVHHHLPEFTQTHVHRVRDAIQPSHPQSSPSPPAHNPSQHQSLSQ